MVYQRKGDWDQAIEFYRYALTEVEKSGNLQGAATVYMYLGNTQTQKGEWPEAIASLNKSLELSEQLGDRLGMARGRANLGMLHSKQGEKAKARALWAQALELLQSVNAQNEADIVRKWLRAIPPASRQ
jgi:tetratricopeptide (TPR) repeat protein